jgi:hypothetical protein
VRPSASNGPLVAPTEPFRAARHFVLRVPLRGGAVRCCHQPHMRSPRVRAGMMPGWPLLVLVVAGLAANCTGPDGGSALPSGCPSTAPTTGSTCASPGTACSYSGCTACVCESNGTWACPGGRGDCGSCPTTVSAGASCDLGADVVCIEWTFCGTECSCYQGKWACSPCGGGDCGSTQCTGEATSCPSAKPQDGSTCTVSPTPCQYAWPAGCAQATCSCGSGHWSCSYADTGCQDGG